jgi:CBS domain-containing protein
MVEAHVRRLLVADREKLVGVVSTFDLLRSIMDPGVCGSSASARSAGRARESVASRHPSTRSTVC